MFRSKKFYILMAGFLIVILGAVGLWVWTTPVRISLAQAASPTATPGTQAKNAWSAYRDFFLNAFASRLGTTSDKVKQAYSGAINDTIDQEVKDGKLTQAQADQLKQDLANRASQGDVPGFFGPFGFERHGFGPFGFGHGMGGFKGGFDLASLAKALNMTQADLTTALQSGKTIADLATQQKVDIATVKASVLADLKAMLDQAVAGGKLTQAQADNFYNMAGTRFDNLVNQTWPVKPFRGWQFPKQ